MNRNRTEARATGIASWGHAVFAVTLVGLGILGLIQGNFTPTWMGVPKGFPAREALAYLCAFISLVSGIGLLWQRTAVVASRVLLTYLLVWLLLFRVSHIFLAPKVLDTWWGCGDTAVMAAGAWVLYAWFAGDGLAARAHGLGGLHRRCLPRGGRGGAPRCVCTAGGHALGVADGPVHAAGMGTHRRGRPQ